MKKLLALTLCVLLLAGCTSEVPETTAPSEPEYIGNSPVPNIRTGINSQGMSTLGNGMEVTESGVYFMCYLKGLTYLLYADHDSDTFVKLCARPDCTHSDRFCNAYFENGTNVYYDGTHLYVGEVSGTYMNVYRLDPDGSNRTIVMDTSAVREGFNKGGSMLSISNGCCFFTLGKMDGGTIKETCFYYKLDGSMEQPERLTGGLVYAFDDGTNFIVGGNRRSDGRAHGSRLLWDPETNTAEWFVDQPEWFYGYVSKDGIFYVDDGVLYRRNAATETTDTLFDTGLRGDYEIEAFPEYFIIRDTVLWWKEGGEEASLDSQTLRFYNWDFEKLGECEIDFSVLGSNIYEKIIAGESKDRIYLAAHQVGLPEYYIEKSDLETGKIKIHRLALPEDIEMILQQIDQDAGLEPWEE